MTTPKLRIAGLLTAAALAVGACGTPQATPSPAPTPSPTVTAAVTPSPTPSPTPTPTPTPAPTQLIVAVPPAAQLLAPGQLTICSDLTKAPQEFRDTAGNPTGSDIEIATEIAKRLGLKPIFLNTATSKILATLTSKKCDIIVSAQVISYTARKSVDMVQYFHAGQVLVVTKGNPNAINTVYDLCGKSVSVRRLTSELDHLAGRGLYNPAVGLTARCQAAGKKILDVKVYANDAAALGALEAGKVAAVFTTTPVAGAELLAQPDQLELVPNLVLSDYPEGISVGKKNTVLRDDIGLALKSMMADGTYLAILKKYGDDSGAVTSINP